MLLSHLTHHDTSCPFIHHLQERSSDETSSGSGHLEGSTSSSVGDLLERRAGGLVGADGAHGLGRVGDGSHGRWGVGSGGAGADGGDGVDGDAGGVWAVRHCCGAGRDGDHLGGVVG